MHHMIGWLNSLEPKFAWLAVHNIIRPDLNLFVYTKDLFGNFYYIDLVTFICEVITVTRPNLDSRSRNKDRRPKTSFWPFQLQNPDFLWFGIRFIGLTISWAKLIHDHP